MNRNETDIQFPDHEAWGKGPEPRAPREPHAGDHGPGGDSTKSTSRPAQASAPLFQASNWIFGTFFSLQSIFKGTGVEVQRGQYAELDLTNGYMTTGDFESTNVTRDVTPSKGLGGIISLGVLAGIGTASGMEESGSGASLGSAGPKGGASIGYSKSTPDENGHSGYQGLSISMNWSPIESVGASASHGYTRITPLEIYNLNIEKHIKDWMNRIPSY